MIRFLQAPEHSKTTLISLRPTTPRTEETTTHQVLLYDYLLFVLQVLFPKPPAISRAPWLFAELLTMIVKRNKIWREAGKVGRAVRWDIRKCWSRRFTRQEFGDGHEERQFRGETHIVACVMHIVGTRERSRKRPCNINRMLIGRNVADNKMRKCVLYVKLWSCAASSNAKGICSQRRHTCS